MKHRKLVKFTAGCFIWLLGLTVIWWLAPVAPRDGWRLPKEEKVCGFLGDNRTVVTAMPTPATWLGFSLPERGPIHLWDIETGQLLASHFETHPSPLQVSIIPDHDLLAVTERFSPGGSDGITHRLRVLEARSGKEVTAIQSKMPQDQFHWAMNPDASLIAYATNDSDGPCVECRDVRTGQVPQVFRGWQGPMCFSADGRRLAVFKAEDRSRGIKWAMTVWDVAAGRQLASFTESWSSLQTAWPISFSPDGALLLDSYGRVWDIASGQERFQIQESRGCLGKFDSEGRYLLQLQRIDYKNYLTYWNVNTGREESERRVLLNGRPNAEWRTVSRGTSSESLFLAQGMDWATESKWRELLNKFTGVRLPKASTRVTASALVDTATRREICFGVSAIVSCSPNGKWFIARELNGDYRVWNIPPEKPLRRLLPVSAAWSVFIVAAIWWQLRRKTAGEFTAKEKPADGGRQLLLNDTPIGRRIADHGGRDPLS